ncbi:D-alanyl-D-alanine carboxypeptidase/D-alanyl-D-alanine-endopeptidase [Pseudomonas sp. JM0905a]|uniref:D-alanyl-D-alanine carboxypeptidase/D-alanyl-D-alanine-endopeptidase n=1 Tax=Metapseudomonas resinovorans TaxID=53412 RepID=A0ABT4Y3A8_METRE|nr:MULTISPECIES: D-alanyl-D-alanine carboxypeptidase/D-alanyl-D-alanine-endopeptidase [Pseudomonas]MBD2836660.1 D-alanyl-D-alanine carboxypeptidase/D-alanyl-D-alanine-endopeptidase [Pseudomonas sp. JM0905a]MDA8483100.1 D-alanyl-D-alanine carboxypeptidase/D-alanyl-D-alanine-endopeptidase [Pseudomonas resinovorans]
MFKSIRTLTLAALILPVALPLSAAQVNTSLPAKVQKALTANKISANSLSLVTLPLTGPGAQTLVNADVSVNPASTMKLITTYAALELLGPTYQWKTEFYADGPLKDGVLNGNLYLKGGGDPKLNMEKLWLMMRDLRANGVREVTGDLVLDRSYFNHPQLPSFNDDGGDDNKPFLVGPDSLLINLKAVRLIARAEGGKASLAMEPPLENIRIENKLQVTKAAKCPSWPDVRYNPVTQFDGTTLIASGKLPEGCSAQTYMSLLDHPGYAAGAVRAFWKELGGTINGKDRAGDVPKDAKLLARSFSPDLVEVIRDINKYSNNTMAQQLFLSIGARYRTDADGDDAKAAQRVIRNWLAKKGITAPHLVMENGSGLSRNERVSAREMATILQAAWQSPYAAEFISSLPLVAMDGTMRKRLRRTALEGEAHIKTGTLNTVRAIAGFSRDSNGNTWAVVAILNDSRPWGASAILDQVLVDLYRQPKGVAGAN